MSRGSGKGFSRRFDAHREFSKSTHSSITRSSYHRALMRRLPVNSLSFEFYSSMPRPLLPTPLGLTPVPLHQRQTPLAIICRPTSLCLLPHFHRARAPDAMPSTLPLPLSLADSATAAATASLALHVRVSRKMTHCVRLSTLERACLPSFTSQAPPQHLSRHSVRITALPTDLSHGRRSPACIRSDGLRFQCPRLPLYRPSPVGHEWTS